MAGGVLDSLKKSRTKPGFVSSQITKIKDDLAATGGLIGLHIKAQAVSAAPLIWISCWNVDFTLERRPRGENSAGSDCPG